MLHKQIRIPKQNVLDIMRLIGSIEDSMEFVDLINEIETKKPYSKMIQRCDQMETVFIHLESILSDQNIEYPHYQSFDDFNTHLNQDMEKRDKKLGMTYFDLIETEVLEDEKKIKDQIKHNEDIKHEYFDLLENYLMIDRLHYMFGKGQIQKVKNSPISEDESKQSDSLNNRLLGDEDGIHYIAGICNTINEIKIKRMIFRASKGRAIPGFFNVSTLQKEGRLYLRNFKEKKMFFVIVQGSFLLNKINSILKIFNCHIIPVPSPEEIKGLLLKTQTEMESREKMVKDSQQNFINFLKSKVEKSKDNFSLYALYRAFFKREKLIFSNLNKCNISDNFIIGEVYIPEEKFDEINEKLNSLTKQNEQILPTTFKSIENNPFKPPTYFKINDFIYPFQEIVSTYGVPRYKEANPALFTIISFPFLFGVMFGDIGHGFVLFLISAYLCIRKKNIEKSDSLLKSALRFRYILLLMGFFAFYCGLMYNDFMALPLTLFSSCYETDKITKVTTRKQGCVYPMGIDPKWYAAKNDLAFLNSFKMKWSVIIGVIQMMLGIILRGMNNIYFKDKIGFFFEFIPQIIFMSLLFGYMVVMIYIKWATDWSSDSGKAPSIISILMGMALRGGSVEGMPLWGSIEVEEKANYYFFVIACICVPFILIPKPIILMFSSKSKKKKNVVNQSEATEPLLNEGDIKEKDEEKHQSGTDLFVHQCIETIEFVLGAVSNTASYLRLWALSLAHAQLSKVFLEKSLLGFAHMNNIVLVVIGYFVFAHITVGVLMGMDLMESFLHTLRLHWVEFQNKFFSADGVKYHPFSFKILIEGE